MTVCVATLCELGGDKGPCIVGASDRMLTIGNEGYQPPVTKVVPFLDFAAIMFAGSAELHAETINAIDHAARVDPTQYGTVMEVVELYRSVYSSACRRRAEQEVLRPVGLDLASFLDRKRDLRPAVVEELTERLLAFRIPQELDVHAIIAGVDATGGHLWSVQQGDAYCYDRVGFVAIGSGDFHARSQLMVAEYTPHHPLSSALMLTYAAKRRAEITPYVGTHSDVFMIGRAHGGFVSLRTEAVEVLDMHYMQWKHRDANAMHVALTQTAEYLAIVEKAARTASSVAPATDSIADAMSSANEPT
jgi:hypothetical protein